MTYRDGETEIHVANPTGKSFDDDESFLFFACFVLLS